MYRRWILGIDEAMGALDAMMEESKKPQYWPYGCFAIVDAHGELVCFARMDGAVKQGVTMAMRKAYTAALWGKSTTAWSNMIDAKKFRRGPFNFGPDYTTIPGGVAIISPEGKSLKYATSHCIGAIGVATCGEADADEAVAMVGLNYIENRLWPESAGIVSANEAKWRSAGVEKA